MSNPKSLPFIGSPRSGSERKLTSIIPKKPSIFLQSPKQTQKLFRKPQAPVLSPSPSQRLEFFESYKSLPKYSQRKWKSPEPSPRLAYLEDLQKNQLQPKPFGMNSGNEEKKIDLHGFSIGDSYAHAFSEGLKHFKTLESLNLRSNRLSEKGAYQILSNLQFHPVRYLSLSDNVLGEKSVECILAILRSPKPYLKHLNLENTKISFLTVSALASVLCTNKSLISLGLAKNNLMSNSCKALKEMLHYNEKLKKLDLHWNCIKAEGAAYVLEGLQENKSLEELDISWNSIGSSHETERMTRICSMLSTQQFLKHLDISYNYINASESEHISKALEANHTLLGLHVSGNDCEIDAQGFIVPKKQSFLETGHFINRIIDSPKYNHKNKTNCWVCEGWKEVEFCWNEESADPVFLHLQLENFSPEMMEKKENGYFMKRAVPNGEIRFFFSVKTDPVVSKDYKILGLNETLSIELQYWPGCNVSVKIPAVNLIDGKVEIDAFKDIQNVRPRERIPKYSPPSKELIRIQWNLGISIFRDYKFLTKKTAAKCFEFDWKLSKIINLVKNPLQQVQIHDFLQEIYENVIITYKHLSAFSGNEICSVNNYVLIDFLNECKINDSLYTVEDLGVNWNSVVAGRDKSQIYNPGNSLIRFQFLEVLIRIANDRFVRNKICGNVVDACRKLFVEQVLPSMSKFNKSFQWRQTNYLTEEVDLIYKAHKPILEALFKRFSGRKTLPGQKLFMSLEEFRDLCKETHLETEQCSQKEIDLSYIISISIQIDEVFKKRHLEMNFVEFLEALARVCDQNGSQKKFPVGEKSQIEDLYNPKTPGLHENLEALMQTLLKSCPSPLKENFVFPTSETYKKMMFTQKSIREANP